MAAVGGVGVPAAGSPRCAPGCVRGDDRGLMTLEWLLIVGLIAGLAASTALIVQRVVDDTAEVPVDPLVRLIEADVEAAFIAAEAQSVFDAAPGSYSTSVDDGYKSRCDTSIPAAYSDVAAGAAWSSPSDPNNTPGDLTDDEPAECDVTPLANLGG